MYWFDIAVIALCLIGAIWGAMSGLVRQLARLIGIIFALYGTVVLNDWATARLQQTVMSGVGEQTVRVTAFFVVFVVIFLAVWLIGCYLRKALHAAELAGLDRLLGAVFGAVKMLVISAAITVGLAFLPFPTAHNILKKSEFAPKLLDGVQYLMQITPAAQRDTIQKGINKAREAAKDEKE